MTQTLMQRVSLSPGVSWNLEWGGVFPVIGPRALNNLVKGSSPGAWFPPEIGTHTGVASSSSSSTCFLHVLGSVPSLLGCSFFPFQGVTLMAAPSLGHGEDQMAQRTEDAQGVALCG